MNQRSTDSSISSSNGISADAISRRAYEIWEREGRPEGSDLRHWLAAEQELGVNRSENGQQPESASRAESSAPRNNSADTRPMQGTRGAPPISRDTKRPAAAPVAEKNGAAEGLRLAAF
jgi:hypothetical protein